MAISIKPDGTITVENLDELRIVLAATREQPNAEAKTTTKASEPSALREASVKPPSRDLRPVASPQDLDAAYRTMWADAVDSPRQQKLMQILATHPRMFSDIELRQALALGSNLDLRGLLIGIVRRANVRGLPNPIKKETVRQGRAKRSYRYGATIEFRRAMNGYMESVAV